MSHSMEVPMDQELEIVGEVKDRFAQVVAKLESALGSDAALVLLTEEVSDRLLERGLTSFQLTAEAYLAEVSVLPRAG